MTPWKIVCVASLAAQLYSIEYAISTKVLLSGGSGTAGIEDARPYSLKLEMATISQGLTSRNVIKYIHIRLSEILETHSARVNQ